MTELSLEVDAFGTATELGAAAASFVAAATGQITTLTRAGAATWGDEMVVPAQPFVAGSLLGYVLASPGGGDEEDREDGRPLTAEVLDGELARLRGGELEHLEVQVEWLGTDRALLGAVTVDHLSAWLGPEYPSRLVVNLGEVLVAQAGADTAAAFLAELGARTALAAHADAAHVLPSLTSELLTPEELAAGFGDGAGLPLARAQLRGVGWATLVAPQLTNRLGGSDMVVAAAPCEVAVADDRGAVWLHATQRVTEHSEAALERLRAYLAPVLPVRLSSTS